MTKLELKGVGVFILIACAVLVGIGIYRSIDGRQPVVNVEQNRETIAVLSLNKNTRKTIKNHYGTNVIVVKDGKANVVKADCKNQICVHSRAISEKGETIVCLPHKLVLTVTTKGQVNHHDQAKTK